MNNKGLIAIIDSNAPHREKVHKALVNYYDIQELGNSTGALQAIQESMPELILVSGGLKPMHAVDFIRCVRADERLKALPIVYIAESETDTNTQRAKEAGADATITRPYPFSVLLRGVSAQINAGVERAWEALPSVQRDALKNGIVVFNNIADALMSGEPTSFTSVKDNCRPLVQAIENNDFKSILDGVRHHDDYTYAHSMRVATMLSLLGHAAGFKNDEQLLLASGGLLHDVGKMKISHTILNKPGRLTDEEFEIMKSHVPETVEYLKMAGDIPKAVFIIAEQHHEKLDGTGYPHGLKGKELNELARMAAVVDVFSALTDRRVYKPPMEAEKALEIMSEEMTQHLDQNYVKMFEGILGDADLLE
ncbi:MAG: HD domain-containing protein [Alphaproteobacteria bacterium]|nr:HD domain-containing protein [Alphaproteobacteria bacterium]